MNLGLVLSGGGIKGIAHLGVAKALYEHGIRVNKIAGTSAGAILGAFLAKGYDPDEIFKIFKTVDLWKLLRPSISDLSMSGLFNMKRVGPLLKKYFPLDSFTELKIPLIVTATNLNEATVVYFSAGPLIRVLKASCAIPGVFIPVEFEGKFYVDGAVVDNFPVNTISDCDFIIGSYCNHLPVVKKIKGIRTIFKRSIFTAINAKSELNKTLCHILIDPEELSLFSEFEISKADEIFEIGYKAAIYEFANNPSWIYILNKFKSEGKLS